MNFGDILEKWENAAARNNSKKNEIEEWLAKNQIIDKDAKIGKNRDRGENRRRLRRINPDDILDIHGLTSEKAWISLDNFFSGAREKGFEKLRIIHGKGNRSRGEAVLMNIAREYIEKCEFAGESGYEKAVNGGTGATWVLLKNLK